MRIKPGFGKWIRSRRDEAGQALIEAAVAAPLLFLILMGAAELARVAYMAIEVANAARAGVEYAAQNAGTMLDNQNNDPTTNGVLTAAQDDGYNVNLVSPITATATPGETCSDGTAATTSSTAKPTCASGAFPLPYITVTASAQFSPLIHIPGLPTSFTLKSSATQTCVDCP